MITIAAILKNEQPYIIEWLAYHMALGIKDFYIADNISTDGGSELLSQLDKAKLITRLEHPTVNNTPPQLSAYNKILSMLDKKRWVAFIDADEFICPNNFELGLEKLVPLLEDENNGAISLNWAVYGSSHSILPENGLVIERFTKRAAEDHPVNKHYKSLVRVEHVLSTGITPHSFNIKPDKKFIMPNGELQELKDGISNKIDWTEIRLNHYVVKSRAEFLNKKAARGRATTLKENLGRNITFFNNHDINTIEQSMPLWFIRKVKDQIEEIKSKIKDYGFEAVSDHNSKVLYRTFGKMGFGVIDSLKKEKNIITLKGWAVDNAKKPLHDIVAIINNKSYLHSNNIEHYDRPDVKNAGIGDGLKSGFISTFELPLEPIIDIQIYAINKAGLACVEFNLGAYSTDIMACK